MRNSAQQRFDQDYLFVRREMVSGKFKVADVRLWLHDRTRKVIDETIIERTKLVARRLEINPERELAQFEKLKKLAEQEDKENKDE